MSNPTDTNRASEVLPEQGGFNERLDEILEQLHVRGCEITDTETHKTCNQFKSEAKAAIYTLAIEESNNE